MAYVSTTRDFPLPAAAPRAKGGFFRRLLSAIEHANMRRAERDIARYFAVEGKFTDETEREIERRFLSNAR